MVLFTTGEDIDWPDNLDANTGRFQYFGDNKTPGRELHDTRRGGNRVLRRVFDLIHGVPPRRQLIPPFFVFHKYHTELSSRSVQFKGLAVPGYEGLAATEDLVAIWKRTENERFQNYRAVFTILDAPKVSRTWLIDINNGLTDSPHAPEVWNDWVKRGVYRNLSAERTTITRPVSAQLPDTETKSEILTTVWRHFKDSSQIFEQFAAHLFVMHDQRVIIDRITQFSRDGGRDAVGRYRLGLEEDPVYFEFSLEAKCYQPPLPGSRSTTVGVRDVARLISRIRHRQFGVLVTTSTIQRQAYDEVRQDGHPIVFICAKDITDVLTTRGLNTPESVKTMLNAKFPTKDT